MNFARLSSITDRVVSPASEFPQVTLYHGSFLVNLDSILTNGIVPRVVNASATTAKAVDDISDILGLDASKRRELASVVSKYAVDRIEQSKFDKVYLSGERSFAVSNAKAGGEWYETIVDSALRMVHEGYYDLEQEYGKRTRDLERAMKQQDEKLRSLPDGGDIEEHRKEFQISRNLDKQYRELQRERETALSGQRRAIKQQEDDILRHRFGDKAVLFTVSMPYSVFVSKIASGSSRDRVGLFEDMYAKYLQGDSKGWFSFIGGDPNRVWEFFQEVHLSGVEPRFIKGWEGIA